MQALCKEWSNHTARPFITQTMASLTAKSSKLPLMQQELWVHTKVPTEHTWLAPTNVGLMPNTFVRSAKS